MKPKVMTIIEMGMKGGKANTVLQRETRLRNIMLHNERRRQLKLGIAVK